MSSFRTLVAVVVVTMVAPVISLGVVLGTSIFMPLPATLPEPKPTLDSQISRAYDIDGNEIAVFREFETSTPVEPEDIPQVLKDAVVASEDRSFYSHGGVDLRGTFRALWADIRSGGVVQGGSTITQQYVRNAYAEVGSARTLSRKVKEAILASQLDRQLSKDEILFLYLSTIYFGEGAYGAGAAAETYFRIPVSQLTLSQAALLAGVIPAPSRYSPRVDPVLAEQRRVLVLDQMLAIGSITQADYDAALPFAVFPASECPAPPDVLLTLICPPVQQQSQWPWFTDYLARWLEPRLPGGRDQLYRGGLRIYTTLDPRAQAEAEAAVRERLDGEDPDLQMALVAVEPPTGYVRAVVGGRDFGVSQVNNALGAQGGGTGRQPGSSFKPVVLATAFAQGVSPSRTYSGRPFTIGDDTVENYGGAVYGNLDLRTATWKSVNAVYAHLILDVGVEETMNTATALGMDMPAFDPAVYGASVALGAIEVSTLQMAAGFGVFANRGRRAEPSPVVTVIGPDDQLVLDMTAAVEEAPEAIPQVVADNVTDVLRGVLTAGTAAGKGLGERPAAGKTGTSQDNANAWFVGYTPTLSTAVWLGYQSANIPLEDVAGVRGDVTGGSAPALVWQRFMEAALADVPITEFDEPAPIRSIADQARLAARHGFDAGEQRFPARPPAGGPYVYGVDPPAVDAPTTTSTTEPPPTTPTIPNPPTTPFTLFPN